MNSSLAEWRNAYEKADKSLGLDRVDSLCWPYAFSQEIRQAETNLQTPGMQGTFLIVTGVVVPAGRDRELDRCIHDDLFTSLLTIPSAVGVMSLRLLKGDGLPRVMICETKGWGTSVRSAYDAVTESDSAKTSAFASQSRTVYRETNRFGQAQAAKEECRYLLWVQMDVPPGLDHEFNNWYNSEHIPMLMQVPGWMASTRYILIRGGAPKYMTIYELEGPWAVDRPEHEMTHRTEWYRRVRPHFENFSSLLYEQISELQRQ